MSNGETYLMALLGGVLIGVGSAVGTAATGRIPGISGVFGRLLRPSGEDVSWRVLFLVGLIGGAAIAFGLVTSASAFSLTRPLWVIAPGGLLVGFGTRCAEVARAVMVSAASALELGIRCWRQPSSWQPASLLYSGSSFYD